MISNEDILNAKILILDDSQSNVTLLQRILSSAGYTSVLGITDPREALELYKDYRPDLILLDIRMPHLDGFQVMDQLKGIEQNGYVSILVLSALHDEETLIRSLKSGAKDFLTKPFDQTEALMRIRNMLETSLLYRQVRNQNDILEQKIEERTRELSYVNKKIQRERKYTENLIDTANDAIVSIDQNEKVIVWNLSAEKIFGYSKHEMIGQLITTIIPERYKDKHQEGIERFLKTGNDKVTGKTVEVEGLTKDGIEIPIEMSIARQKLETGLYSFTAIIRDVTEKLKWVDGLKRAKVAAEEAVEAKSEFLANMSHEVRTSMNGVIGMTDLLLSTPLTPEQYEYADIIRESSESLLNIINDILDFSKIESGKLLMEEIDFDLQVTVNSMIDLFAFKAGERGLIFNCFIDPEVPSFLRGDPGRLRQVLINLISNAIKFTNYGQVDLHVSQVKDTVSDTTLRFDVRDTGIGIPDDRVNRLFQSFTQVDSSTTRKYGGTGLGLAISKQITELMRGQIGVKSEEDRGSTFWFTVTFEKQSSGHQAPIELGKISNMRVLIVGNNSTNCHALRKYLESWNCCVKETCSAEGAMKKLRDVSSGVDRFKVVLINDGMPWIDGKSLGKEIKSDPQLKDLLLVMLTSYGQHGDAGHLRNIGFEAFLTRPIKQAQLFDCLQIVTGKSATSEEKTAGQIVTKYSIEEVHKKRVSVLVVEDNIINQKVALRILNKKPGYHSDVANNGREAIASLEEFDYDLVLMDCQMPEIDGYEATKIIRDENSAVRNHNIPIIAMTANAMKGDREKCLKTGMDDYITKPIKAHLLSRAIERQLNCTGKF